MGQLRRAVVLGCIGWLSTCPYFDLRSNAVPLAFGMTPDAAAAALDLPLTRASSNRGAEIYYAERTTGWTAWYGFDRHIWLQFRRGRLTGWKDNWDRPAGW